ncbi:demethoxyubiquinone hydroxylase family protein [Lyticum sinuosum]|uniref:Demethoxyubiquinone hydroxylase family protein n=1 Tax=Lyticum sinuosum TaxID=1332059 RepID=A0AAE4VLR8_9RICK|nr:demethoxyubiquinone hydroxylase family protein [Lyticum sinuosum]MDZ5761156.1 Demethoxyubiquinone hydroxylase family protein [Lyticum sinuosum]
MKFLPGDKKYSFFNNIHIDIDLKSIIRVNHAGEMGACQIYRGQIFAAKLKNFSEETIDQLYEMLEQEIEHFLYFSEKIINYKVRPTLMSCFWKIGGFFIGFITAMINEYYAMACTEAVEEVIDIHYQKQIIQIQECIKNISDLDSISTINSFLKNFLKKIEQFRLNEIEHKKIAENHNKYVNTNKLLKLIKRTIKLISLVAIFVAKKI